MIRETCTAQAFEEITAAVGGLAGPLLQNRNAYYNEC